MSLCECGCGQETVVYRGEPRRFITGHNMRGATFSVKHRANLSISLAKYIKTDLHRDAIAKAKTGVPLSDSHKKTLSEGALREKLPLPNGFEPPAGAMAINKECSNYLGCFIAERVLSNIFKNTRVMPKNNHGYDIICNKDLKIDIKSSCRHRRGTRSDSWAFSIGKNTIADYFLLLTFDNRESLNPEHLWLIPGDTINHLIGLTISESQIHKFDKYVLEIDKVISCCNTIRGD